MLRVCVLPDEEEAHEVRRRYGLDGLTQPVQSVAFLSSGELLSDPIASQAYMDLTRNEVEPALAAQLLTGLVGGTAQVLTERSV